MQLVTHLKLHMWLESDFPRTACSREHSGLLRKAWVVRARVSTALLEIVQMGSPQYYDPRALQASESGILGFHKSVALQFSESTTCERDSTLWLPSIRQRLTMAIVKRAGSLAPILPTPPSKRPQILGDYSPLPPPQLKAPYPTTQMRLPRDSQPR